MEAIAHGLERYLDALHELDRRLGTDVLWVLAGSLAQRLQGVPLEPHDIDIMSDRAGVYEIERRFAECVVRPVTWTVSGWIRSHWGGLRVAGVEVDLMGDIEKPLPDGSWDPPLDLCRCHISLQVGDLALPVLPLAIEYQELVKLGRTERAAMLRRQLDSGKEEAR